MNLFKPEMLIGKFSFLGPRDQAEMLNQILTEWLEKQSQEIMRECNWDVPSDGPCPVCEPLSKALKEIAACLEGNNA